MTQTICGISRRSAAIGAILTHGMATNSLRLICMTKVLQCDTSAKCDAQPRGHRVCCRGPPSATILVTARLERCDRIGQMLLYQAGGGRRRYRHATDVGGQLASPFGGHPGSYLKYDGKVLHFTIGTRGVSLSVAYHTSTASLGRLGLGGCITNSPLLLTVYSLMEHVTWKVKIT